MLTLMLVTVISLFPFVFEKAGIHNTGKAGLFSMRILEIKKVTSAPEISSSTL